MAFTGGLLTPTPDGVITVFYTPTPFITTTNAVVGTSIITPGAGADGYLETNPGTGEVTFGTAPDLGTIPLIYYQDTTAGSSGTIGGTLSGANLQGDFSVLVGEARTIIAKPLDANGVSISLVGKRLYYACRLLPSDTLPAVSKDSTDTSQILIVTPTPSDPSTHYAEVFWRAADTTGLGVNRVPRVYLYDFFIDTIGVSPTDRAPFISNAATVVNPSNALL